MALVSTWSRDAQRGLAHPESVSARQIRLAASQTATQQREEDFECALKLLRQSVRTEGHVVRALHVISSALTPMAGSNLADTQGRLDELADEIEYREQS